jgi:hypothetical protein
MERLMKKVPFSAGNAAATHPEDRHSPKDTLADQEPAPPTFDTKKGKHTLDRRTYVTDVARESTEER